MQQTLKANHDRSEVCNFPQTNDEIFAANQASASCAIISTYQEPFSVFLSLSRLLHPSSIDVVQKRFYRHREPFISLVCNICIKRDDLLFIFMIIWSSTTFFCYDPNKMEYLLIQVRFSRALLSTFLWNWKKDQHFACAFYFSGFSELIFICVCSFFLTIQYLEEENFIFKCLRHMEIFVQHSADNLEGLSFCRERISIFSLSHLKFA